ncbi:MAG TPA: nucleotidyltransferase family protein, partial [Solirubrobacteraceae bacterium]|nr:nucleotidyltransferase family protein [Solirubrobacteraceae bacterium]
LGRTHELTTLAILDELERSGIRALALKGSVLAREVHGDVGLRSPGDIDILVSAGDLAGGIEVLGSMGWTHEAVRSRAAPLPVLHETLSHPSLPRVELHWRVHWYERRFAADALAGAERAAPHEPLVMRSADGLAALILFYARDGFAGLRMAADVAAWWDTRCSGLNADQLIEETAVRYCELGAPLRLGAELLGSLVGLPTCLRAHSLRLRVAAQLVSPFAEVTLAEARAKVGLVDLLLAPPHGARAALRRERQKVPPGIERPLTRHDDLAVHLARSGHLLRMLRRWVLAVAPPAVRTTRSAFTTRPDAGEDDRP